MSARPYMVSEGGGGETCFPASPNGPRGGHCLSHIAKPPVNFLPPPAGIDRDDTEGLTEQELEQLEKDKQWKATGLAYALEHATRPATIGLVLSTSPLALLAWIGEKLLDWADTPIPLETILRMTTLYWFTSSVPRNIYPYRNFFGGDGESPISTTKPLGYSAFKDLDVTPEAWCKHFPNLKFRKAHGEVSEKRWPSRCALLTASANRVGILLRWNSPRPFSKTSRSSSSTSSGRSERMGGGGVGVGVWPQMRTSTGHSRGQ